MSQQHRSVNKSRDHGGRSVAGFLWRFALVFAAAEILITFFLWKDAIFLPYAKLNARLTAALLSPWLEGVQASERFLISPLFTIQIRPGCDSYQASAVLLAGIAAFPAPLLKKLGGAAIGLVLLMGMNVLRLAAILLTGIHHPTLFNTMHLEILPGAFVVAALALWLTWALWSRGAERSAATQVTGTPGTGR